jgi:hypothetical protein
MGVQYSSEKLKIKLLVNRLAELVSELVGGHMDGCFGEKIEVKSWFQKMISQVKKNSLWLLNIIDLKSNSPTFPIYNGN